MYTISPTLFFMIYTPGAWGIPLICFFVSMLANVLDSIYENR
jgi:hypothetical protein